MTWVWETSRLRCDLREEVEGRRLVCSLSMLNDCAGKGHAPVGRPLSMVSQIKSWYSLTVWCPCDRARCLIGSPQRDHLSDSNKQQLDGHYEVQTSCRTFYCPVFSGSHEVSRLTARHLVDHVLVHFSWFAGSTMGLDQHKSVGHAAHSEGKDRSKDDHVRFSVDALSNACTCVVLSIHWPSLHRGICWPFAV